MQITNTTGKDLYLAALQIAVADGDTVDVDDVYAELLIAQGWKAAKPKASKAADKSEETETEGRQ